MARATHLRPVARPVRQALKHCCWHRQHTPLRLRCRIPHHLSARRLLRRGTVGVIAIVLLGCAMVSAEQYPYFPMAAYLLTMPLFAEVPS